jgi:hypothetical protein
MLQNIGYEDFNLFIGFITLPPEEDFFNKEIKENLFESYKKDLKKYSIGIPADSIYYSPKAYYIFGEYDLGIIALVDDLSLESKIFHPNHGFGNKDTEFVHQFRYKVISGFIPHSEPNQVGDSQCGVLELFKEENKYKYIAICELKLNNGLLFGNGLYFCHTVKEYINKIIKSNSSIKNSFIIETNGCEELSLFLFGDDLVSIKKIILTIKESQFISLKDSSNGDRLNEISKNSLISKLYHSIDFDDKVLSAHIFSNSNVFLGFSCEYQLDDLDSETIIVRQKFHIKTGHLGNVINTEKSNDYNIRSGRSELVLASSMSKVAENFKNLSNKGFRKNINKIVTDIEFKNIFSEVSINQLQDAHPYITMFLREKFIYSNVRLQEIKTNLRKCKLSKIYVERVMKMLANYNENVVDPVLSGFFIELKGYLDNFLNNIAESSREISEKKISILNNVDSDLITKQSNLRSIHLQVDKFIDLFEIGFKNRIFHSYLINNLTDINLEYNGGIQQICTALDNVYKSLCTHYLGAEQTDKFIYVSGFNGADSTQYGLRINYFHIFQPEFFAAIVHHEAFNQFITCGGDKKLNVSDKILVKNIVDNIGLISENGKSIELRNFITEQFEKKSIRITISESIFVRKVFSDFLTLQIAYKNNIDLYHFWWWHNAFQVPQNYNQKGDFSTNDFFALLLRNIVLYKQTGHHDYINKIRFTPITPICNTLWIKYFDSIEEIAESILAKDFFINLKEDLKSIAENCKSETESQLINEYVESMLEGRVVLFKEWGENTEIKFVDDLIYSYLIAFKNLVYSETSSLNFVLKRSQISNTPNLNHILNDNLTKKPQILFDPRGGTFIISHAKMKDTMKLRAAFIKSLWHLSMINKLKYFANNQVKAFPQ